MLGLPRQTELNRPLPKREIFAKFKLNAAEKRRFDDNIRRLAIVHEVSPATVNIADGENVNAFYVVLVSQRGPECDPKTIALLSRLIGQNILFVLDYEGKARLAVLRGRVLQSGPKPLDEWEIKLTGLHLDSVWENIIVQVGGVEIAEGHSLDQQIAADAVREKLLRRIEVLERQARNERQPRKKFELVREINQVKNKVDEQL
jgi:hypothetical protein